MNKIDIRQAWLDYYKSLEFKEIPSAPLVHPAFPTSFNMSAGMVQLDPRIRMPKKIAPSKECLVQKCVRYFDIPKVGDESHLSFFEMAGAFEVVDFDERKTITDIWNFLTEKLNIDPKRLWITAFDKERVVDKTISLPQKVKDFLPSLGAKNIVYGDKETNLWQQGGGVELTDNIRMCGPQVEFFYDRGKGNGCNKTSCNPFCNCGRFLEIANILFIAYYIDYKKEPTLKKLVNPSTEAVIGIERVALITEEKENIFETSYFTPLIKILGKDKLDENCRIIVDHIKSLTHILAEEKVTADRRDRGRIMRTLIRQLLSSCYVLNLNTKEFIPKLVDEVINLYKSSYPEIQSAKENTLEVIFDQESAYQKTLKRGKSKIEKYLEENKINQIGDKEKELFRQKYGVPPKLTQLLLSNRYILKN